MKNVILWIEEESRDKLRAIAEHKGVAMKELIQDYADSAFKRLQKLNPSFQQNTRAAGTSEIEEGRAVS